MLRKQDYELWHDTLSSYMYIGGNIFAKVPAKNNAHVHVCTSNNTFKRKSVDVGLIHNLYHLVLTLR